MPHYRLLYDRDMIAACDLMDEQGGPRPVTLTIAKVERGELNRPGTSKKEHKPILSFQRTDKRLVCNATNGATIAQLYGKKTEGWVGKRITLAPSQTKLRGVLVDCVRVQSVIPGQRVTDTAMPEPPVDVRAELSGAPASDEGIPQ